MKKISLIKVTLIVIAMASASSLVSAEDTMTKKMPAVTISPSSDIQFEELDLDENNYLSFVETEKHELLHNAFTKIDSNDDATISENEFDKFIK